MVPMSMMRPRGAAARMLIGRYGPPTRSIVTCIPFPAVHSSVVTGMISRSPDATMPFSSPSSRARSIFSGVRAVPYGVAFHARASCVAASPTPLPTA